MDYEKEYKNLKEIYEDAMDDFRQTIGERDDLEDQDHRQKQMIKKLEDEKNSLSLNLNKISTALIAMLKES
jgi:predicted nuclease with TOPRIM domain